MNIHTVFSVDNSAYLHWQSELLWETFKEVKQPGKITRLVALDDPSERLEIPGLRSFNTQNFNIHPWSKDPYPPYNKPYSLREWLSFTPDNEENLLILDPDMVFLNSFVPSTTLPLAEKMFFMDPQDPPNKRAVQRFSRKNTAKVQPIGIPLFLPRSALCSFVGRWCELTYEMRQDKATKKDLYWIIEMWACAIAAAEFDVHFQLQNNQQFLTEPYYNRTFIHYSYDTATKGQKHYWSKRTYQPWNDPPPAPTTPETALIFWQVLSKWIPYFQNRALLNKTTPFKSVESTDHPIH